MKVMTVPGTRNFTEEKQRVPQRKLGTVSTLLSLLMRTKVCGSKDAAEHRERSWEM